VGRCQLIHECLVEVEELAVLLDVWDCRNCLSNVFVLANDWVVHQCSGQIEALFIILVQHSSGDVWNISPSVRFAGNVNLEVFDGENIQEVLEEGDEVVSRLLFASRCDVSGGETKTNWIFDPGVAISTGKITL
jgi:hypothetical protein